MNRPTKQSASAPVAEEILRAAQALIRDDRRCLLGLVGPPAAGKSRLAAYLAARLSPRAVNVAMDGFHLSQRELRRLGISDRKGAPDTFDVAGYRELLDRIRCGYGASETVYAPDFEREHEEPIAASTPIAPDVPLVITEGNYLLLDDSPWADIAPRLDETWFLHVETEQRETWLAERHQRFGRSAADAWAWIESTDRPNAVRIEATAVRADRHLRWDGEQLCFATENGR